MFEAFFFVTMCVSMFVAGVGLGAISWQMYRELMRWWRSPSPRLLFGMR
jgi:hypothetical protein